MKAICSAHNKHISSATFVAINMLLTLNHMQQTTQWMVANKLIFNNLLKLKKKKRNKLIRNERYIAHTKDITLATFVAINMLLTENHMF